MDNKEEQMKPVIEGLEEASLSISDMFNQMVDRDASLILRLMKTIKGLVEQRTTSAPREAEDKKNSIANIENNMISIKEMAEKNKKTVNRNVRVLLGLCIESPKTEEAPSE